MKVMFGIVERVKARINDWVGGYATVIIPDLNGRQVGASFQHGPCIVKAWDGEPHIMTTEFLPVNRINVTDEVVVELDDNLSVIAWAPAHLWRKTEADIAKVPVYRVVRDNWCGRKATRKNEIVFTGWLSKLAAEQPRDGLLVSNVDKFAPTYHAGPFRAANRFEVKRGSSDWVPCEDPRPLPKGHIYRMMFVREGGQLQQLAIGSAFKINAEFPRSKSEPLIVAGKAGQLYFERYEEGTTPGAGQWREVVDPRPLDFKKPRVKKESLKGGFKKVYHGLEALGELTLA